jgi:hypothetical protein
LVVWFLIPRVTIFIVRCLLHVQDQILGPFL